MDDGSPDGGCGPITTIKEMNEGLPGPTTDIKGMPPKVLAQNKAIRDRYGANPDEWSGMAGDTEKNAFSGPGMPGRGQD